MVPENNKITYHSLISTLIKILKKHLELAYFKQKSILEQDWTKLQKISIEQKELSLHFDKAITDMNCFKTKPEKNIEEEIIKLIEEYREIEKINTQMLNDSLFVSKKKVEKYFNTNNRNDTYNMNDKKDTKLWDEGPYVLNEYI